VLVVGLGRFGGGIGVTRWLVGQGAIVTVTDQADRDSLAESIEAIADTGASLHLGGHNLRDLDDTDLVVVNPAVNKSTSTFFQEIVARGVPWTTEMNLFCERCLATVIGVTGTYGKSTTCAMLAHVLEACRSASAASYTDVHLGGNIGRSLLIDLPTITPTDLVVLEMSNAQLEDLSRIEWAPHIAVITNLYPHHLDRYAAFADYVAAKLNIIRDPHRGSTIVLGELHAAAESRLAEIVTDGTDRIIRVAPADPVVELIVPGRHNQSNAACVLTVCRLLGLDEPRVRAALRTFKGLPHRLEFVRTVNGVDYYNDSKSTAPSATMIAIQALESTSEPRAAPLHPRRRGSARVGDPCRILAIVGGQSKEVSLTDCAEALARACRIVICCGESGALFAEAVRAVSTTNRPTVYEVPRVEEAVRRARAEARPGEIVLFSPGAPSFDQYANFTERGRHFVDLVNAG
jgi:UDP-N-acetylmuramoylalanine--D-glutamate ligase